LLIRIVKAAKDIQNQNFLQREKFDLETQKKLKLWIPMPDYQKGKYINDLIAATAEEQQSMELLWT
jgi:hypothetical protein